MTARSIVNLYSKNRWIKSLGKAAYTRLDEHLIWQDAVLAPQAQLRLPVHVGGFTALELYGVTQYVMFNDLNPTFYDVVQLSIIMENWPSNCVNTFR